MGQLVKILDSWDPAWERAGLATQAFSASLLFATAAKSCGPIRPAKCVSLSAMMGSAIPLMIAGTAKRSRSLRVMAPMGAKVR